MTKADELAISHCAKCQNKNCSIPCSDVLVLLFLNCQKSPHELQEMMESARKRAGL